jgi:hypothetical protein
LQQYDIEVTGEKPVGKGNFVEVWKAKMNNEDVAVKIITNKSDRSTKEMEVEMETFR